jgi:hypothetical protein
MLEYEYIPDPAADVPDPEFTTVKKSVERGFAAAGGVKPEGSTIAVLHCLAMARDAIARSPLKTEWTRDAFGWLDGAVAILTKRGGA